MENTHPHFFSNFLNQLNPKHPLLRLSEVMPWNYFEQEFSRFYSHTNHPVKPLRLMVGLMILKYVENVSDEILVERWVQNPYYQAFCGETKFQLFYSRFYKFKKRQLVHFVNL